MGLRVRNLLATLKRLEAMGRNAEEEAIQAVKEGAQEIADLATNYAPRDLGDLEASIRVWKAGPKSFRVGVDDDHESGHKAFGRYLTVGEYAYYVHENIGRGAGSYGKNKGGDAGPFFLSRASEELDAEIRAKVKKAMRRIF